MNVDACQQKAALRRRLRTSTCSAEDRAISSARLCDLLERQPVWQNAAVILFYVPRPDEPDIWPLAEKASQMKKVVAFPRSLGGDDYVAGAVADLRTDLRPGRFGILEPSQEAPEVPLHRLDLTLVPGLAFTLDGGRLGRGKGYYDRLLAKISGLTCGVAFDWQIISDLPMEPHDVRLTCILTPSRWWTASRPSSF